MGGRALVGAVIGAEPLMNMGAGYAPK